MLAEPRFYARTGADASTLRDAQLLEDHLRGVGSRARVFCQAFRSGEWGRLAGLWHDLGKYRPEFQRKLRGERLLAEHSGAGAALAVRRSQELGPALAFAIAGHHAGLANPTTSGEGFPRPLSERIQNNKTVLEGILGDIPPDISNAEVPNTLPSFLVSESTGALNDKRVRRRQELWIRFLFSALVDSDRLDAEAFFEPANTLGRGRYDDLYTLRDRLDAFIDRKAFDLVPEERQSPVNQARQEVLRECREKAEADPGVFSLTVPTGGGKTLAALSFALRHATLHDQRRVIAVIPFTSIIEQNAAVYSDALGERNVLEHHSMIVPPDNPSPHEVQQATRRELAMENWDAPVVVTTTVQFFESLLSNRPSRCRKIHNIAKSVIVLDEVQTLPPAFLATIVDVLQVLVDHYGCTVVLSTATPPALKKRTTFEGGFREIRPIVSVSLGLATRLRRARFEWPHPEASADDWTTIADGLAEHPRVLTIVHRRDDARILAGLLEERAGNDGLFHLSALMCPAHRSKILAEIRATLQAELPCRVVSTQLVEAGVDLDFPVVYRALGGLDSLIQAAGRCNREGRLEEGRVVIFKAPTKPPPGIPTKALETTRSLLQQYGGAIDVEDVAVFDAYFRSLYSKADTDANHIQRERSLLNFATVGRDFKLIEDAFTKTVVVPYGESTELLEELRAYGPNRTRLRALQPYVVNVYDKAFTQMLKIGALEEIGDGAGIFGLTAPHADRYNLRYGLIEGDAPPNPEALVV